MKEKLKKISTEYFDRKNALLLMFLTFIIILNVAITIYLKVNFVD